MKRREGVSLALALGGEGAPEERGAVQVNLPRILDPNFVCASDGRGDLGRLKRAGPVVVSRSSDLPFARGSFDKVIARGVPVCRGKPEDLNGCRECKNPPSTHLGEVYCLRRVKSLLTRNGVLDVDSGCLVDHLKS